MNDSIKIENGVFTTPVPEGPLAEKWTNYKSHQKLVNPANKRRLDIIVVGTGLAGASAAASLGELGFNVLNFCIQDSPRRAHSIAAQGGINAAKNYQYIVFITILLKGATIVPAKPTYTVWQRYRTILSTNVWHRVFPLLANTAVCSTTVRSAELRYRVHSTPKGKQVSSCCSVHTLPYRVRYTKAA